jgi:hypothetical protein
MTSTTAFSKAISEIDAANASIAGMFGGDVRIRGYRNDKQWITQLVEAERFVQEIVTGRRPLYHFREAMGMGDFPKLFADSLDRKLYGAYQSIIPTWRSYARAGTVNDFREVKRFATGGVRGLLQKVGEGAPHERRAQTETEYKYAVNKYEAGFAATFEAMINDDLGAFMRLPEDLAASVRDTEEEFVTRLFCDASGPHATHYTVGNDNILTGNPALTRPGLQSAITKLMKRRDANGNPIVVTGVQLVVGPGLTLTAQEIINASEYRVVGANGDITIVSGNGVAANLSVSTNYWIPAVASTANADTSWWVFANPTGAVPAMEFSHLRGFEAPALFEKLPDAQRIGGGVDPFSFDTATQEKKIMAVHGGGFVDPKMTVASNGSGS